MFSHIKELFTRPSGYTISRSVRLRSSASAYLNRTPAGAGSRTTWTLSYWVKLSNLGTNRTLLNVGGLASGYGLIFHDNSNQIDFQELGGSTARLTTSRVYRDPSAWYHIVCVWDSSNATASDRMRIYTNGVRETSFVTQINPALNAQSAINTASLTRIGWDTSSTSNWTFDGYLTEINFIDGQALTPSSFGQTNTVTGVWQPIKYTGTYGTNGFYLNFSDNSAATATTIGKDYSGNGNNWTPNNISVTAGATYDSMLDVPTLYADGGNGRGNFAVWNPLSVVSPTTLADGNLGVVTGTTGGGGAFSTITIPTSGKYYFEFIATAVSATLSDNARIGLATASVGNYVLYKSDGNKVVDGTTSAYGSSFALNDVIGCAIDVDGGTVTFYKNNVSQGSITYSTSNGNYFAHTQDGSGTVSVTANINFGQRPFTYTPPTGFVALNTQNLPTPTISNGANYMAATLYTGTGSSLTIANTVGSSSFYPDFVWVKGRSGATDHALYDSVRGTTKDLASNTTAAETTQATGLTAFGSTGFTVGALAKMNTNAATYVGWQWLANAGSTVSNTSGSITSTVSAGATQGFSVVQFTATGSNATVGHGLGVAPAMVIVKDAASVGNWAVYHQSLPSAAYYLYMNTTAAQGNTAQIWNSTAPTSTVFSIGTWHTADRQIAYCFAAVAGYSAFGSYTGNGSTDGTFVYTGFRPRWIMIKRTDLVANWTIIDTSMSPYNVTDAGLLANSSGAQSTGAGVGAGYDILSNGFKARLVVTNEENVNNATHIYAAFAENPFKYSLAR